MATKNTEELIVMQHVDSKVVQELSQSDYDKLQQSIKDRYQITGKKKAPAVPEELKAKDEK